MALSSAGLDVPQWAESGLITANHLHDHKCSYRPVLVEPLPRHTIQRLDRSSQLSLRSTPGFRPALSL